MVQGQGHGVGASPSGLLPCSSSRHVRGVPPAAGLDVRQLHLRQLVECTQEHGEGHSKSGNRYLDPKSM